MFGALGQVAQAAKKAAKAVASEAMDAARELREAHHAGLAAHAQVSSWQCPAEWGAAGSCRKLRSDFCSSCCMLA